MDALRLKKPGFLQFLGGVSTLSEKTRFLAYKSGLATKVDTERS